LKRKLGVFLSVLCASSMVLCTTAFAVTNFSYGVSVTDGVLSGGTGSSSTVSGGSYSDAYIGGTGVTAAGKNVNLNATISDDKSGTSVSVDVNVKNGALGTGIGSLDTYRYSNRSESSTSADIYNGAGVVGSGKEVTLDTSITGAESSSELNVKVKDGSLSAGVGTSLGSYKDNWNSESDSSAEIYKGAGVVGAGSTVKLTTSSSDTPSNTNDKVVVKDGALAAGAGKSLYAGQYSWNSDYSSESNVQLKKGAGVVGAGSEVKLTTNLPGTPSDIKDKVIVENGALGAGVGQLKAQKYDDGYLNSRAKVSGAGVVTAGDAMVLYPNVPGIPSKNYILVIDGVLGAGSGMQSAKKVGSALSFNSGDGFVTAGEYSTMNPYPPVFAK
jgi:hypothetical protein